MGIGTDTKSDGARAMSKPIVQDPAVRAVLLTTRRALLLICAAIAAACGIGEAESGRAARGRGGSTPAA